MTVEAPAPPARWRLSRAAVLVAVFVCAACGLVYELALVALGSYLIGDTVGQASIVLGVMVFAMGVGALAAKPLQPRAAAAFAAIELALALLGGLSVLGLYAAFAWLDLYGPALIGTAFVLGLLIGAEIPLLMVLLQRIREQAAGSAWPTCSRPTTSARCSAGWPSRSCCCRSSASSRGRWWSAR